MDHRNLFGIGFILLSTGYVLRSLQPANASMPVGMQHGQFPYQHYTECTLPGATPYSNYEACSFTYSAPATHNLLTVPNDRILQKLVVSATHYVLLIYGSSPHPTKKMSIALCVKKKISSFSLEQIMLY